MKTWPFKRKQKPSQGRSGIRIGQTGPVIWYKDVSQGPQAEQLAVALSRMQGRWSTGTELDVSLPTTLSVSEKPKLPMPEAQAVVHELLCGGEFNYLPEWVFSGEVKVPGAWFCAKCNHLLVPGFEDTYFAV